MKKTITILMMLFMIVSFGQSLILTEDTVINDSENFSTVRTNGFNLHVNGALNVSNFVMLNKGNQETGGSITATDDIIIGSNIFFFEDEGYIHSNTGISVTEILGKGTVSYCTFLNVGFQIGDDVTVVQDCSLSVDDIAFKYDDAELLYYFDISGKKIHKENNVTGLLIGVYELKGIQARRKDLLKEGIKINR